MGTVPESLTVTYFLDDREDEPGQRAVTQSRPAPDDPWALCGGEGDGGQLRPQEGGRTRTGRAGPTRRRLLPLGRNNAADTNPLTPGDSDGTARAQFLQHKQGFPD